MSLNKEPKLPGIDFAEPRNCICAALGRAQRAVHRRYVATLKNNGITPAQFTILTTLGHTGEITITNLAKAMGIDRTTLTRTLAPLVQAGWVADQHQSDQRVRRLAVTGRGRKIHAEAVQSWQHTQADFVAALGEESAGVLIDKLRTVEGI